MIMIKKILGKILSVMRGIAHPINESKDRAPVNLAKLGEAGIDLARGAGGAALPKQAPTSSYEMGEAARTLDTL